MKKLYLAAALLTLSACTFGKIEPGHVGIVVPLSGNTAGQYEVRQNGWYFYSFNTQVYEFPTYNLQHSWTNAENEGHKGVDERLYFMDRDGQRLGADIGIQYNVPRDEVVLLFTKYRDGLDHLRDTVLKNTIRNALNIAAQDYKAAEIFGDKRGEYFAKVLKLARADMDPNGLHIDNLYLNGELELPQVIRETITASVNATQLSIQKENEKRAVTAEAAKNVAKAEGDARSAVATAEGAARVAKAYADGEASKILTVATAQAKANQAISNSLNSTLLELKRLEINADIQKAYAEKWQGGVPTTILPSQGTGLFLDMRRAAGQATIEAK
jgi:hypothetical protein